MKSFGMIVLSLFKLRQSINFDEVSYKLKLSKKLNRKYYISNRCFFIDLDIEQLWEFMTGLFRNNEIDELIIIEDKNNNSEIELTKSDFDNTHFINENPFKIIISQNPFMVAQKWMSMCYHYKMTEEIFETIEKDFLKEIKEDMVTHRFIVCENNKKTFWFDNERIVGLLYPVEVDFFNKLGVEFKEWDIKLNDTLSE